MKIRLLSNGKCGEGGGKKWSFSLSETSSQRPLLCVTYWSLPCRTFVGYTVSCGYLFRSDAFSDSLHQPVCRCCAPPPPTPLHAVLRSPSLSLLILLFTPLACEWRPYSVCSSFILFDRVPRIIRSRNLRKNFRPILKIQPSSHNHYHHQTESTIENYSTSCETQM